MADPAVHAPAALGRGIVLVLLANLLFSVVDTSAKWLIGGGLVVAQLAFMRYAVHFAITLIERLARGRAPQPLPRRTIVLVLLRSFCLVSATLANFVALGHLSLTVSSALLYLSPLFIGLFARALLGEAVTTRHWYAIFLGLFGALVILWPVGEPLNWYAVLMLYPAMAMALYQVLTRALADAVRPGTLQLYTGALGTLALLPFALLSWTHPSDPLHWTLLVAIGAFAWAGHEALTRAHQHAAASTLAPFGYSFVVYLSIASIVVFADMPPARVYAGVALILVAGLIAWRAAAGPTAAAKRLG